MPGPQLIRSTPASRRTPVTEYQARHFADLIDELARRTQERFGASPDVPPVEFFELPAYRLFLEGAYACALVMTDGKPENPFELDEDEDRTLRNCDFPTLRQYVHFLMRHERWADGLSSPILEALRNGSLQVVADRLRNDRGLYEE